MKEGEEMTQIIAAIISAGCALLGSIVANYLQNSKKTALILYRLDELEKKQDKHNGVIERQFKLEKRVEVLETREKVSEHRIDDLEKGA